MLGIHVNALGNPSPVSLGDQRFKAYSYLVLATIFCAMTAFYLTGLTLAVADGTIFNSTNIAVIVASQMFCMTMTLFHFERGYKARRKLLNLSSELPGPPAINSYVNTLLHFPLADGTRQPLLRIPYSNPCSHDTLPRSMIATVQPIASLNADS